MFSLFRKKQEELMPVYERKKKRYRCPFYEFHIRSGELYEENSQRCALIIDNPIECKMKRENERPDWNSCYLNNECNRDALDLIAGRLVIFPSEFKPKNGKIWEGIKFEDWLKYVMKAE